MKLPDLNLLRIALNGNTRDKARRTDPRRQYTVNPKVVILVANRSESTKISSEQKRSMRENVASIPNETALGKIGVAGLSSLWKRILSALATPLEGGVPRAACLLLNRGSSTRTPTNSVRPEKRKNGNLSHNGTRVFDTAYRAKSAAK
jgi:hypothetical protein